MSKTAIAFVLTSALFAASPRAATSTQEKNHATWWITNYGLVDRSEEPRAARAEAIFARIAAASDKRANRLPRLAILDAEGNPFAMALPDGTILLTRGALRMCYANVSEGTGDARLAFVIGHELSHLGNDDFWHAAAFDAVAIHGSGARARDELRDLFRVSAEDAMKRELQADAYGMLYMTIAGYDPQVLLRKESFFEEWAMELDALGMRSAHTHPEPAGRSTFMRSQLAAVTRELDFFHFGVRLMQLGRFQDGLLLLERFRDRFPSREVLNNIGVAHFQLAARFLGNCDGRLVVRFKLPTVLDPSTRAVSLRSAGGSSTCFQTDRFRLHFREAERNLNEAAKMDPTYVPARLNLISLYALAEQGARAIVASEEAEALEPDDPRVQTGAAIALFLYGEQSGLETTDAAVEQLQQIQMNHPSSKEATYNLAAMLAERRRVQAAEEAYRAFLELEDRGIFADSARNYLGLSPENRSRRGEAPSWPPPDRVSLGSVDLEELLAGIPGLEIEPFVIGDFNGAFLRYPMGRALVIDETVELVEKVLDETPTMDGVRERLGPEVTEIPAASETLFLYEGIGIVFNSNRAVGALFFAYESLE